MRTSLAGLWAERETGVGVRWGWAPELPLLFVNVYIRSGGMGGVVVLAGWSKGKGKIDRYGQVGSPRGHQEMWDLARRGGRVNPRVYAYVERKHGVPHLF